VGLLLCFCQAWATRLRLSRRQWMGCPGGCSWCSTPPSIADDAWTLFGLCGTSVICSHAGGRSGVGRRWPGPAGGHCHEELVRASPLPDAAPCSPTAPAWAATDERLSVELPQQAFRGLRGDQGGAGGAFFPPGKAPPAFGGGGKPRREPRPFPLGKGGGGQRGPRRATGPAQHRDACRSWRPGFTSRLTHGRCGPWAEGWSQTGAEPGEGGLGLCWRAAA